MGFADIIGQSEPINILKKELINQRIQHAYLFTGREGTGKKTLALEFTKSLMCENEIADNCGYCKYCRKIVHKNHPDVRLIEAADNSKIKIEQMRNLQKEIAYRPYESDKKIYIIDKAGMMTDEAANSLLKTLEEPPDYAIIILLAEELSRVLPTIISRCQHINIGIIPQTLIKDYLIKKGENEDRAELLSTIANGSIGRANKIAEDDNFLNKRKDIMNFLSSLPEINISEIIEKAAFFKQLITEGYPVLNLLSTWYRDIIMYKSDSKDFLANRDFINEIRKQIEIYTINELFAILELIQKHRFYLEKNVRSDLILQVLLLKIRAKKV